MPSVRDATPEDAPAIAVLLGDLGYPAAAGAIQGRLAALGYTNTGLRFTKALPPVG